MRTTYQKEILEFLSKQSVPQTVEAIRRACGIGNWNTAIAHLFELTLEGEVEGLKTSFGWVFSKKRKG